MIEIVDKSHSSDCVCVLISLAIMQSVPQTEEDLSDKDFTVKFFLIAAKMIQLWQALVLALSVGTSTSTRQFLPLFQRDSRSLRDSFPFSAAQTDDNQIREDRQVSSF